MFLVLIYEKKFSLILFIFTFFSYIIINNFLFTKISQIDGFYSGEELIIGKISLPLMNEKEFKK